MKKNLMTEKEREKAKEQLRFAIEFTIEHDAEDPYYDFDTLRYDGDMEPILVAISQAMRWTFKLIIDNVSEEEKAKLLLKIAQNQKEQIKE